MAVMGVVSILAIQALVSVAIFNYFRTHHQEEHHWWTTITAPIIATISQVVGAVPGDQQPELPGRATGTRKWLCWADLAIFVGGLVYAFYLKSNDRAKYETIGRMINSGMDAGPTGST